MEAVIVCFIILVAIFYIYKHLKGEVNGDGGCNCSSCPVSKKDGCSSADKKD